MVLNKFNRRKDIGNFLFSFHMYFRTIVDIVKDVLLIILLWQLVSSDLVVNIWGNLDNYVYGGLDITKE